MTHRPLAHSFVLRIWLEEEATSASPVRWRGQITNPLDERTVSVETFEHVEEFVADYIRRWGERTE